MTFNFNPDDAQTTWPDGDYMAEIQSVEEKESQKGNQMLVVKAKCKDASSGTYITVTDYIVESVKFHISRLKKLCKACDVDFDKGKVDADALQGKVVWVTLRTDEGEGGFDDKNVIRAYMPAESKTAKLPGTTVEPKPGDKIDDKDIPF